MGMKNTFAMMSMFAAMTGQALDGHARKEAQHLSKKELEERIKRKEQRNEQRKLKNLKEKQGLKEFFYGENIVYARNQKNADRKARNKGYIK
jgi:hypothetical protein